MESKYQRWYDEIITRALPDRDFGGYSERHHILPRALGGGDEPTNLVVLTYREHFLVHWLLTKIYDGEARRPMVWALHCMTMSLGGRIVAGWQFEVAKRAIKIEVQKRAAIRKEEWMARKKLARKVKREARIAAIEQSEREAPRLDPIRDRFRMWEMANSWTASYGRIKRERKKAAKEAKKVA
jgi:hypothetical protein